MTFLSRFFRPKWQHADPQTRCEGVAQLSLDAPAERAVLQNLAEQDPEPEVRRAALRRLSDLVLLRRRAADDPDAAVREMAAGRYRQLLAGTDGSPALAERLHELTAGADEAAIAHVARRGREPELRLAALERLRSPIELEQLAVHADLPKLRLAAVSRLDEPAALERVARQCRERDRKVARIARERLDRLRQAQADAEQAAAERTAICEALEQLAASDWHETAPAERQRLENRWQAVAVAAPAALQARYEAARQACDGRAAAAAAARAATAGRRADAAARLESALAALRADPQPDIDRLEALRGELDAARAALAEAPAAQQGTFQLLSDYLEAATRYLAWEPELAAAAEALSGAEPALAEEARQELRRGIDAIAWPAEFAAPTPLARAAAALAAGAPAPRRQQQPEQSAALREVLAELEEHLAAGRLKPAQRLLARAQKLAEQVAGGERERLERRLKRDAGRVRELQDWRRFATLPKQIELCEQMEALIDADLPPPVLAEQIHRLQEAWKETGGSASAEGQQLWERFRNAGERAFERCREYFEEQALRRQENLARRGEIARQLVSFVAEADWERLDVAALEAIRGQARREWLAAAPVDRRAGAAVEAEFEPLMETITGHIRDKQRANRDRKQALVDRARALTEADDPRAAAEQAKALQAEWKAIGPAQPNLERKLWREFRAACDAVFGRRDAARSQADQERQVRTAQAEAVCAEAEALAAADGAPLAEIETRFAALRDSLRQLRPLGRDEARAFDQRLREAERRLEQRRRREAQLRRQAQLKAALERAALCEELERAALAGETVEPDAFETRWQAAEPAPAPLAGRLAARWQRARAAADGSEPFRAEELAVNTALRHELCLRMEILAGVESPPEDRARRMDIQVRRLAEGLTAGRQSEAEQFRELQSDWLGAGPATPGAQAEAYAARFNAAAEAFGG